MKLIYKRLLLFVLVTVLTLSFMGNTPSDVNAANYPSGTNYIDLSNFTFGTETISYKNNIDLKPDTDYVISMSYLASDDTPSIIIYGQDADYADGDLMFLSNLKWVYQFHTTSNETDVAINITEALLVHEFLGNYEGLELQLEEGSTPTTYESYTVPDVDPPLINGATALHVVNYDVPTTVSTFKATLTATDNVDGNITGSIIISRDLYTGNEASLGDKEVDYSVSDSSGNTTTVTVIFRTVDVADPIINLLGGSVIHIEYGNSWSDPGYTATDNYDSSVTVNVTGSVNSSALGNYVLNYNATDTSGNAATQKTRTVIIEDTTAPVQTLQGSSTIYVEFGDNFTDPGATWTDAYDGSGSSVVTGSVNVGVLGSYTLRYNKTDTEGNAATELTRTVIVRDTSSPTFTGETNYTFNTGSADTLANILNNISANDLYDGLLTSSIVITTDNYSAHRQEKGIFTVLLTVEDSQGNSETMTLTIEIIDNQPPVFSTSENIYTVEYADTLTQEQLKEILGVS